MVKDRKKRSVKSENPSAEFNDFILDSFVSHQEVSFAGHTLCCIILYYIVLYIIFICL